MQGWLDLLNRTTGTKLNINDVLNITYQTIHRTASACLPLKNVPNVKRLMIYQLFIDNDDDGQHYKDQMTSLRNLMGNNIIKMGLMLCRMDLERNPGYRKLVEEWDAAKRKGSLEFSKEVKAGLITDNFIYFNKPEAWMV
jgi:hypothetical protein